MNGTATNLEQDAVSTLPLAMKELAKLPRIPRALGSKPTPFWVILQGADGFQELRMPPDSRSAGTSGEPFQCLVDFPQRFDTDSDRVGHRIIYLCSSACASWP